MTRERTLTNTHACDKYTTTINLKWKKNEFRKKIHGFQAVLLIANSI